MALSCASLNPNLDEGTRRANCRDTPCSSGQGMLFWKRGSKTLSARLGLALHHLHLCKCSWRLKPWQEVSGTNKSPGETGTGPYSPRPTLTARGQLCSCLQEDFVQGTSRTEWRKERLWEDLGEQIKLKEVGQVPQEVSAVTPQGRFMCTAKSVPSWQEGNAVTPKLVSAGLFQQEKQDRAISSRGGLGAPWHAHHPIPGSHRSSCTSAVALPSDLPTAQGWFLLPISTPGLDQAFPIQCLGAG